MSKAISTPKVLLLVAALAAVAGITAHRSSAAFDGQAKPTREIRVHEEGGLNDSADLDDLWAMSDVVVHAVYLGDRPDNKVLTFPPPEPPATLVRTAFRFQVLELFKPRSLDLHHFEISRFGGRLEKDTEVLNYVNDKFAAFEQGQQYLLFLKQRPDGMYVAASSSPDSEFHVTGTSLEPRGRSGLARSLAAKGVSFLNELRKRAR